MFVFWFIPKCNAPGCEKFFTLFSLLTGVVGEVCWEADATGVGLATADAALALTP